jgi:hypothetical protein
VDEDVSLQLVRVGEGGVAEVALVRLLASVDTQMTPEVGDLEAKVNIV